MGGSQREKPCFPIKVHLAQRSTPILLDRTYCHSNWQLSGWNVLPITISGVWPTWSYQHALCAAECHSLCHAVRYVFSLQTLSSPDCPVSATPLLASVRTSQYHTTVLDVWEWLKFEPSLPLQWQVTMSLLILLNLFSFEDIFPHATKHHVSCCLFLICLSVWRLQILEP